MKINMADVEVRDFEPVPDGWYHVMATDVEVKEAGPEAKNPGSEYWAYTFIIQDGPHEGRNLWTNVSTLPQALFTLKGMLLAMGDPRAEGGDVEIDPDFAEGQHFYVKVGHRTYNDNVYNEIKQFKTFEGQSPQTAAAQSGALLP